jgi:peptide/nickel transport system permease protein
MAPLLEADGLTLRIPGAHGDTAVVSGVSFSLGEGEIVGMVGESGCGKTLTGLALMGLLPDGVRAEGAVRWKGREVLGLSARERRALMGREIAMVYHDALQSLNPGMTVRAQLKQALRRMPDSGGRTVNDLLELVQLPDPERIAGAYPFALSGGQRQRVLIALALTQRPQLLVADEPTTALDETVQAQIIDLLVSLQREFSFSTLLISHNIALVGRCCERMLVLYAGQLIEAGPTAGVIHSPLHPYSRALVEGIVSLERRDRPARSIPGSVPNPVHYGAGCRFVGRCERERDGCAEAPPRLEPAAGDWRVACYAPYERTG